MGQGRHTPGDCVPKAGRVIGNIQLEQGLRPLAAALRQSALRSAAGGRNDASKTSAAFGIAPLKV